MKEVSATRGSPASVDPPVLGQYRLGQTGHIVVDGHVGDMASDTTARGGHVVADTVRARRVHLGDFDERTVLREQPRDARADAGAPPVTTTTRPSSNRFQSPMRGTSPGEPVIATDATRRAEESLPA